VATSGLYAFNPGASDLVLNAYSRIQLRATELVTEHLTRAEQEFNLLMVEWSNRQVNLWTSQLGSLSLVSGTATYTLPEEMVTILIAYISTDDGAGNVQDRVITPLSTTDYASLPNKLQEAYPTSYWFNRQIDPTITMWPVPDDGATYTLKYRYVRQVQDVVVPRGIQIDAPYRLLDAAVSGLAYRLAMHFKPELKEDRLKDYDRAWTIAATQDTENVNFYIIPGLSSYTT
jgi:hypothetical protein